jgi:hypothetical protein
VITLFSRETRFHGISNLVVSNDFYCCKETLVPVWCSANSCNETSSHFTKRDGMVVTVKGMFLLQNVVMDVLDVKIDLCNDTANI